MASNLALAVVLLIVLVLQAVFNAWQDFSTSRVMGSIQEMLPTSVLVIRNNSQASKNFLTQLFTVKHSLILIY